MSTGIRSNSMRFTPKEFMPVENLAVVNGVAAPPSVNLAIIFVIWQSMVQFSHTSKPRMKR